MTDERLKIWVGLGKFVVATVIGGVAITYINADFQRQRLESEIKSKEGDFIAQFVDNALDEKLEKRRDFAEYFVRLAPTEESRERWIEYRDYTVSLLLEAQQREEEIAAKERERDTLLRSASIAEGSGSAGGTSSAHGVAVDAKVLSKIAQLEAEIARQRRELTMIRSDSTAAIVSVPDVVGIDPSRANSLIQNAGLSASFKSGEHSADVLPGHVVRTNPPPGAKLARGELVELFTSPEKRPD